MGPLPPIRLRVGRIQEMLELTLKRDLGLGGRPGNAQPLYSDHQQYTMQVLAVSFSAFSVASAFLAFYWFRRMRRSFRHDLIMFLIQSDMFKALWFMIYPIVVFTRGPVADSSTFCKVNGFFIALGIEASDFAVLMIAIHSALYIFKPRTTSGEGGLYPYRHVAFALWIILPLLSASLAFINAPHAYITQTTYCYLPIRPFWYRLALSWIPRYVIFVVILVIYASIYLYVRYKFRGFGDEGVRDDRTQSQDSLEGPIGETKRFDLPPTPPLAYHGLIQGSTASSQESAKSQEHRDPSRSTLDSEKPRSPNSVPRNTPWPWVTTQTVDPTLEALPRRPSEVAITLHSRSSAPEMRTSVKIEAQRSHPNSSRASNNTPSRSRFTSSTKSVMGFLPFLRSQHQHPDSSTTPSTPTNRLQLVNSRGQNVAASEIAKQRDKIQRQLRFLFIYPLVYIGMWVLPFVGHVMQYSDDYAIDLPFALNAIINIFVTSQCAVDCWLFSSRERPWRHIPGSKGGFWESFAFWRHEDDCGRGMEKGRGGRGAGSGKRRAEMDAETRAAYLRRDEEIAEREIGSGNGRVRDVGEGERSWWDGERALFDGMSPVYEEANPMERIEIPMEDCLGGERKRSTSLVSAESEDSDSAAKDAHSKRDG